MNPAAAVPSLSSIPSFDPKRVPVVTSGGALGPVPGQRLDALALRHRFATPPTWEPELTGDRFRFHHREPKPAAVLVPIVTHPGGATLLLTVRTQSMRNHAGQVAFPGGRRDAHDASSEDTARREAFEEVGLASDHIEVIGRLPDYLTGTGYCITPIVALIAPGFALETHDLEVAATFEVPMEFLMDPANHQVRHVTDGDIDRTFYSMPYTDPALGREFFIWGATAALIRNLYQFLHA